MKLKTAIELGILCGYKTVDTCISNAEHLIGFLYSDSTRESKQLYDDYELHFRLLKKQAAPKTKSNATNYIEDYIK